LKVEYNVVLIDFLKGYDSILASITSGMGIMEKVRVFLAFEVSEASKNWIEKKKREIMKEAKGAVRWVKRDNEHVTLHFFGKISEETIYSLGRQLNGLAEGSCLFHLKIDGLGGFPAWKNPRVLWAGLKEVDGQNALERFYSDLCIQLKKQGVPVEKRPYTPHVTLGRVKKKRALKLSGALFEDRPECDPFLVREIILFRSDLTPKGPIYQVLNRFPLGGKNYE